MEEIIFKLDRIIGEYVLLNDVNSFDEFGFIKRINDIVFNNCNYSYYLKYRRKYNFNQIDNIVNSFLKNINYDYYLYYQLRKSDGTFCFDEDNIHTIAYSYYDFSSNKRNIYIPISHTLEDAFSIIHELNHDKNIDELGENDTRMIFTESLSILSELLLEDYLKEYKVTDYKISNNYTLEAVNYKSLYIDFVLKLMKLYINKYNINYNDFCDVVRNYNNSQRRDLNQIVLDIFTDDCVDVDFEFRYILGILIATYLYKRIKVNNSNIKELFEMNDIIKEFNLSQVFDFLELEYSDSDLTDDSYLILENNYKKYVRSRQGYFNEI